MNSMKTDRIILFAYLESIVEDLGRQWKRIILLPLLAIVLSYILLMLLNPLQYAVKASIGINHAGMQDKKNRFSEQELYENYKTAVENATRMKNVLESNAFQSAVAAELGFEVFEGTLSATRKGDSNLLEIVVRADDAELAYQEAGLVVARSSELSKHLAYGLETCVLKSPELPKHFEKPWQNVRIACLIGTAVFLLLTVAVVSYSCTCDTIRCSADVRMKTGLNVLAVVGSSKKNSFTGNIQRLTKRVMHKLKERGNQVLLIAGTSEQEGRTTLAACMALSMAQAGEDVILVDLNQYHPSLYDFLKGNNYPGIPSCAGEIKDCGKTDSVIEEAGMQVLSFPNLSLRVLAPQSGTKTIQQKDMQTSDVILMNPYTAAMVQNLRREGTTIILDAPPSCFMSDTEEISAMADTSVLVIRRHWSDTQSIMDVIDTINRNSNILGSVFYDLSTKSKRRKHVGKAE